MYNTFRNHIIRIYTLANRQYPKTCETLSGLSGKHQTTLQTKIIHHSFIKPIKMKKALFALSIGFTSIAALSNCAYAQNSASPVAFNDSKNFMPSIRYIAAMESTADLGTYIPDAKSINAKAVKDFQVRFADADAKWFSDANGFTSYFVKDGYGNRALYDKKGHWQYSLIFFGEDKLPRDVRNTVRSTYFDMNITLVEEVQSRAGQVYIVHLEDKASIKILKINDDCEMEIMQELNKQ